MKIKWIESRFFSTDKISNKMIIIHHTGSTNGQINSLQGTIDWFKPAVWRTTNQVSAHYIIPRAEGDIIQMVRDEHTAWHAGRSEWIINGVLYQNLNNRTIGIELQGDGQLFPYTVFQYEALIWLVKQKIEKFEIPLELIRGHEEITTRKPDPGPLFDWHRFKTGLTSTSVPGADIPVDDDDDGIIWLDETDDVKIPSGKDRTILETILDFFAGLFKR
ncbi:MAG TPA: N-acetylmuramoyl-L-alanine amidase [bacterium]|nr:N-acetylmuramoyl-L-alanine amidase [bacterium]